VPPPVTAVILAFNRRRAVERVLAELDAQGCVDEVIVVDTGTDGTAEMARGRGLTTIEPGDIGAAGRNHGAEAARHELVLMLDDDSYPEPGAVEVLAAAMHANPRLAVATGLIRDMSWEGDVLLDTQPGSFDWFLRAGRAGDPPEGFETFFFAEGGCLVRRDAFLAAGGFFAPYFFTLSELDATMRLAGDGWEVRYFPSAAFAHLKSREARPSYDRTLRLRIRNQLWHYWLRYPPAMAAVRMVGYLAFDLVECVYRGDPGTWAAAIGDAWRERATVAPYRRPLPRAVIRRVERNRGRMHAALLWAQLKRRVSR
jgi:N-acetylglucosaminyl-diphospho-decaprenol L-rhamnosyltransferase